MPLDVAEQVADETGLPLMVHIDEPPPSYEAVVERLRPGDVLTHCFRPFPNAPVDGRGKVKPAVLAARQRGVMFDIGHGMGSFGWKTARAMLAEGFAPDTISSDIHALCINGPAYDQVTTLSKFLALGMRLGDVIAASTVNAAAALEPAGPRHAEARQRRRRQHPVARRGRVPARGRARRGRHGERAPVRQGRRDRRPLVAPERSGAEMKSMATALETTPEPGRWPPAEASAARRPRRRAAARRRPWPSGRTVGVQAPLALRLLEQRGKAALPEVLKAIDAAGGPLAGSTRRRASRSCSASKQAEPDLFGWVRDAAYMAYYENPFVAEAIDAQGHLYELRPHIKGYPVPRFDLARDTPRHGRGRYMPTGDGAARRHRRLDLASNRTQAWGLKR